MDTKNIILHDNKNKLLIDNKDKKILYELSVNCRQSNAEIGRKVGLSKQSVSKRIKQLEKKGVITNYFISFLKIKDSVDYYILIKLKYGEYKKDIEDKILSIGEVSAVWLTILSYDLILVISFPTSNQVNECLNKVMRIISKYVNSVEIIEALPTGYIFESDYLVNNKKRIFYTQTDQHIKLNNNDIKIIELLFNNARASTVELSVATGLSPETISYRIKQLIKNRIICNPKAAINLPRIGYYTFFILILTDSNVEKLLINIARNNLHIKTINRMFGSYNFVLWVEVDSISHIIEIIDLLRNDLREKLICYNITLINKIILSPKTRKDKVRIITEYFSKK